MSLEKFLIYIHLNAYDVAKQFFRYELANRDRKQLRLVSRAMNAVVLEYPILTTLFISTFSPDLDYLEVVSQNEKLLKHVSKLWWDSSAFFLCFLLDGDLREYYSDHACFNGCPTQTNREATTGAWRAHGASQRRNLENDRDRAVLKRILPSLKSVTSVVFTAYNIQWHPDCEVSPSFDTYEKIWLNKLTYLPICHRWIKAAGTYLPWSGDMRYADAVIATFEGQEAKSEFWNSLLVRGFMVFCDLLSQEQSNATLDRSIGLPHFFPKLKSLFLEGFPPELYSDGPVYQIFQRSCIQELHITLSKSDVPGGLIIPSRFWDGIHAVISATSQSLRSLKLNFLYVMEDEKDRGTLIRLMTALLPRLVALSYLSIYMNPIKTTPDELVDFGKAIRACELLRNLDMGTVNPKDRRWKDALELWEHPRDLDCVDVRFLDVYVDTFTRD